jgi:hypothetical protein
VRRRDGQRTPFSLLIAALLGLGAPACSWTFDDSAPEVPLLGTPIPPEQFVKLNLEPAADDLILTDRDGNPWVALTAAVPLTLIPPPQQRDTVHLIRLDAGAPKDGRERKDLSAGHILVSYRAVYMVEPPAGAAKSDPTQPTAVTVFFPGVAPTAQTFMLPSGAETLHIDYNTDQSFLYWVPKAKDPRLFLTRTDGSFQRALPPPKGYDAPDTLAKIRFFFDGTGERLFVQDGDGRLVVHSTREDKSLDLGVQPLALAFSQQDFLLACAEGGLRRVALDGSGEAVVDAAPCNPDILRASGSLIYYKSGEDLRRAAVDGSAPPQVALAGPVGQLFTVSPRWGLVYSLDSPVTYGSGIGDGWLGDWQFMQRGRRPSFSSDGNRLRWLDNAARSDNSGDLSSATIANRQVVHLSRNVRTTLELADGRVLAISNAAFKGTQNRLIVIDEARRTARWVVDSARDFVRIPGTQELLVKIIVGQLGYDIRRVPVPAASDAAP